MSDIYYIWGWKTRKSVTTNIYVPSNAGGFIPRAPNSVANNSREVTWSGDGGNSMDNTGRLICMLRGSKTYSMEWNYFDVADKNPHYFTKYTFANPQQLQGKGYFDWVSDSNLAFAVALPGDPSTHQIKLQNPGSAALSNLFKNSNGDHSPTWIMARLEHSANDETLNRSPAPPTPTTSADVDGQMTYYFCVLDNNVSPAVPKVLAAFKGPKGYANSWAGSASLSSQPSAGFSKARAAFGDNQDPDFNESELYLSGFNNGFNPAVTELIGVVPKTTASANVGVLEGDGFYFTNKTSTGGASPVSTTTGIPELLTELGIAGDYIWDPTSTIGSGAQSSLVPGRFRLQTPPEETDAAAAGVGSADIAELKTGTFTPTNGKATLDSTRKATLKTLIDGAATAAEKRNMRRIVLKLLFAQNADVKKMVIPKEDLDLPVEFTKPNVVVVKSGETAIAISALGADEGFYSVLNDGETFKVTTANTTLIFTRTDVAGAEIYGVTATTWSRASGYDIIINSDSVTGTFSSASKSGTLLPDDKVIIDGRLFIIGSVADGDTSGSGADPYVYPINSSVPVKLPNKCATYRMFEQGDNYVNVEVGRATDDHQERMIKYAEKLTPVTHNIVCDGYFYHKAFISAEGHTLSVDYTDKKVRCNSDDIKFFTIKQSKKKFSCGEFRDDSHCMTVAWETKEGKKIHTEIMFFPNPHIENGINVIPETTVDSTGLIVTNYKPKLMTIPSISTEKYGKLWKRLRNTNNKFQYKSIKGKNEKWHKH